MQRGFPRDLLPLLRCSADGGEIRTTGSAAGSFLVEAAVRCKRCGHVYSIADGILSLLRRDALHPESATEMALRDQRNAAILDGTRPEWRSRFADAVEVRPTLQAVAVQPGMVVQELGCGSGRYTCALAERAAAVVAVDFSFAGLQLLRMRLEPEARVALVQADVTTPYASPGAFDRVLSTLHSNLPSRDHRMASIRQMAATLKASGKAVVSMHHYSLRAVVLAVPPAGRYADSGIYRYYMTKREAGREIQPFFAKIGFLPTAIHVPFVHSPIAALVASHVPLVRSGLATLVLALAESPRREPSLDELPTPVRWVGRLARPRLGRQAV